MAAGNGCRRVRAEAPHSGTYFVACRIELAYDDLQQPERGATERSLFAEQTGQCVYCGRKIALDRNQHYHIEHFRPQKKFARCSSTTRTSS